MRIGALLTDPADVPQAASAGLFGVLLQQGDDDLGPASASVVATRTTDARVLVRVRLGTENPVTLAEEVAVLDHLSAGRVVAVVDPGTLDADGAAEDLGLLRACWSGRPVRHAGARWRVPSGLMAEQLGADAPRELAVTPVPAQVDVPVWLTRPVAGAGHDLPVLATSTDQVRATDQVSPAVDALTGDLDRDRALVQRWAAAGATHLLVRVPSRARRAATSGVDADAFFSRYVARYLSPEVSMPAFPRIMAEAELPAVLAVELSVELGAS